VGPKLRSRGAGLSRGKEWMAHLDEAGKGHEELQRSLPDARGALERLGAEAALVLERVQAKEKFLNSTFGAHIDGYRAAHGRLGAAKKRSSALADRVTELSARAAALADSVEEARSQMDERGSSVEDTSPLVRIKAALQRLRSESKTMDLRLGVLGHTLLQAKAVRAAPKPKPGPPGAHAPARGPQEEEDDLDFSQDDELARSALSPAAIRSP
jgi:estrogen-related receptor beta like 1